MKQPVFVLIFFSLCFIVAKGSAVLINQKECFKQINSCILYSFNIKSEISDKKERSKPINSLPKEFMKEAVFQEAYQEFYKARFYALTQEDFYELSILQLKAGHIKEAKESLLCALNPQIYIPEAHIQEGIFYLWDKHYLKAYFIFLQVLEIKPCQSDALEGLGKVALAWTDDLDKSDIALAIYALMNQCDPKNADTLFYLGRLLYRKNYLCSAEKALIKCLQLAPQYVDAGVVLGNLYLRENRIFEAEKLFERFQDSVDAQKGLAAVAKRLGNDRRAIFYYSQALVKDPHDQDTRLSYAQVLASSLKYRSATCQYQYLMESDPCNDSYAKGSLDARSHTYPHFLLETTYTQTKENDPNIGQPVVRDFYFLENAHLFLPLTDRILLDVKQILYKQKEDDIYPPTGINYNMQEEGGQITCNYFFAKNWKLDASIRAFEAHGIGPEEYPFSNTFRVEPGSTLLYHDEEKLVAVEAHLESFVIKNFDVIESQLLIMGVLEAGLGYNTSWPLNPQFEAWIGRNFYHDNLNNYKDFQTLLIKTELPSLPNNFKLHYFGEHGHFKALSTNYFSYQQQWRNTLGLHIYKEFFTKSYFEFIYEHQWQFSRNLFMPIGNFVFVASTQLLIGNKYIGKMGYRFHDKFTIDLEGHYFRNTLPYHDWNIKGSLLWQF